MTARLLLNINDPGGQYSDYYSKITAYANAAWNKAMSRFDYTQGTINLTIKLEDLGTGIAAQSSPNGMVAVAQASNGNWVYETGAVASITGDSHSFGVNSGITMSVGTYWLTNAVPSNANPNPMWNGDAQHVFAHEITGHGLGFYSYWNRGINTPPSAGYETTYDQNVAMIGGKPYFVGANAEAVYGGPVPLDGSIDHPFIPGKQSNMSYLDPSSSQTPLDIAILRDAGVPILTDREIQEHTVERLYFVEHGSYAKNSDVETWANDLARGNSLQGVAMIMLGKSGDPTKVPGYVLSANSDTIRHQFAMNPNVAYSSTTGEEIARLDDAVFGQVADSSGYFHDTAALVSGMTLAQIASADMAKPAFIAHYGTNTDNRTFVNELYANVLHRAGDPKYVHAWTEYLDNHTMSRADVIVGFSDNLEHITAMATKVGEQTASGYAVHGTVDIGMMPAYSPMTSGSSFV